MTKEKIIKLVDDAVADNPFTEDALALRFSEQHKNDLRFIATKNSVAEMERSPVVRRGDISRLRPRAPKLPSRSRGIW